MSNKLGEKIKEVRLERGMSQEEFARTLGYTSKSTVNKIEKGVNDMSYDKLELLIRKFDLEVDDLFDDLVSELNSINISNEEELVTKEDRELAKWLAPLVKEIWSEHSISDLERILAKYIGGKESTAFYKCIDGKYVGVALCCLRHDYVEGCSTSPVGYLEGIFVDKEYRNRGIAKELCRTCEKWAKRKGCSEFASDCALTNNESLAFHISIGFKEENRIICFKKEI